MTEYRVRRGLFGKAVLQKLCNYPSFCGGVVDASIRERVWQDVDYNHAPLILKEAYEK